MPRTKASAAESESVDKYLLPPSVRVSTDRPSNYKLKLQDPEFHQNLTKSLVYHFDNGVADGHGNKGFDREDIGNLPVRAPYPRPPPPISYLQDSNPFSFRPSGNNQPAQLPLPLVKDYEDYPAEPIPSSPAALVGGSLADQLERFAPKARPQTKPVSRRRIGSDVDIVYNPRETTTRRTTTTTTTAETTTRRRRRPRPQTTTESSRVEATTSVSNSIAEHISSLLKVVIRTVQPTIKTHPHDCKIPDGSFDSETRGRRRRDEGSASPNSRRQFDRHGICHTWY